MKHILLLIWKNIIYLFIFIFLTFYTIWTFETKPIKQEWDDYKTMWAGFMWRMFRINWY